MKTKSTSTVVITGLGPVCPEAQSIDELTRFSGSAPELASDWFDPEVYLGKRGYKYFTPATRYLLAAGKTAVEDANVHGAELESFYPENERGVFAGSNFGVHQVLADMDALILDQGAEAISPMLAPSFSLNVAASYLSITRRYCAFNVTLTSPMIAGLEAVALGAQAIAQGRARMVLAGATESAAPPEAVAALGLTRSAGAACVLVLEEKASAVARGARIWAELGDSLLTFGNPESLTSLLGLKDRIEAWAGARPRRVAGLQSLDVFNVRLRNILSNLSLANSGQVAVDPGFVGADGAYFSVSALLGLATLAVGGGGLIAAGSPLGHVALLELAEGRG